MPLVVMCGYPASGKTTRCKQLSEYVHSHFPDKHVHIISDNLENKHDVYSNTQKEREIRGVLKSNVQRLLSKDNIVILDALNYIKGFRYELYCVAKSCRTTHCVIYCVTDAETSKEWNMLQDESDRYTDSLIDELIMRFECPSPSNRWDKPLFSLIKDSELNANDICHCLFEGIAEAPNQSTQSQPLSSTNFLYQLDKSTQDIVTTILSAHKNLVPGDTIKFPGTREEFLFTRSITLAELQRHRRQFIIYTKMHPVEDVNKLSNMFIQFLNKALNV